MEKTPATNAHNRRRDSNTPELVPPVQAPLSIHPRLVKGRVELAAKLQKSGSFWESRQLCDAILEANPNQYRARVLRAECYRVDMLPELGIEDLNTAIRSHPNRASAYVTLAHHLIDLGRFGDAAAIRDSAIKAKANSPNLDVASCRALFLAGRVKDALQLCRQVSNVGAEGPRAMLALAKEALIAGDARTTHLMLQNCLRRFAGHIGACEIAARCEPLVGANPKTDELADNLEHDQRLQRSFQIRVALRRAANAGDMELSRRIIAQHDADGLTLLEGIAIAAVMNTCAASGPTLARITELARRFPKNVEIQRLRWAITSLHAPKKLGHLRDELSSSLPPQLQYRLMLNLNRRMLNTEDMLFLLEKWAERDGCRKPVEDVKLLQLLMFETDQKLIGPWLARALPVGTFADSAHMLLTKRQSASVRPKRVAMNPKRHSEIAEAVLNSICSSDKSATELKRAAATLRDMIRRSSAHWLDSGDDETSARSLCDWLADRIEKKLPTSVIRLGDGEGNFLPYPPALVAHRSADRRRVQADTWWGRVLLDTATSEEISRTLGTAIEEADLLGIPPVARVLLDLHQEAAVNKRHIRGLITVFHFLSTQQRRSDPITSCNFATDFSRFGLYPALFSSLARVSIISSHDLSGVLQSRFGLSVREHHAIPGEFRNRVETSSDQLRLPNPIFPERFRQLMERINPYRGEVYLVAAGMLGKLMCQRVKEKGGIAIDIGSQADSWMGAVTRIYSAREAT